MGHLQTSAIVSPMSALPQKAGIRQHVRYFRFVPITDISLDRHVVETFGTAV
jgi:hypothetical protein